MKKKYIASYDFGTSGVKAVLISEDGQVLVHASAGYPLLTPRSGWAEQDPELYWQAICRATRQVMLRSELAAEDVVGVVFGTMWKGIIPVDCDGNVLYPCMIWLDARAEKQAAALNERMHTDRFCAQDYWARLMWMREELPDIYHNAAYILENNAYLKFRATGKLGSDLSNCFVTSTKKALQREYEQIVTAAGLDLGKFPPCVMPWDQVGGLTEAAANELGLVRGTPVFGGCGDIPAIAIGSGSSGMGAAHIYLGSSGWLGVTVPERCNGIGEAYSSLDNSKELLLYTMQSACMTFDWAIRCFYKHEWEENKNAVYTVVEQELAQIPAGSKGLIAAPWLHGERLPFSEKARAVFFNINADHDRSYFINAVQEGVCFMLRGKLDAYRAETGRSIGMLRVAGGAAASNHWMQMLSDVLGVPIEVPENARHAGAIGSAYCALIGLGRCADFEQTNKTIHAERRFLPNKEHKAVYDKNYAVFKALYPALRGSFEAINT